MVLSTRRWRVLIILAAIVVTAIYYLDSRPPPWEYDSYTQSHTSPHHAPPNDGKQHWSKTPEKYPVKTLIPLPKGKPVAIPKIQARSKHEDRTTQDQRLKRLAAVKESFTHSWEGYKTHAWLRDEVVPIEGGYRDTFGGWAATLVDSLDTLWIMGMEKDFEQAVRALDKIDFSTTETKTINVFETTIRYLGGFLAAYDISEHRYPLLLHKAIEVGDLLMGCFDTPNRMPISRWDWRSYIDSTAQVAPSSMLVSEIGSLSMEFTRLSQVSGDAKYYDAVQRISDVFEASQNTTKLPGMWPVSINAAIPDFSLDNWFTLGGMSDSAYEYLPKQYLILGGVLDQSKKMYEKFIEVAKRELFFGVMNPDNKKLLQPGDIRVEGEDRRIVLEPKGQHLGCFAGGMVAIGSKIFNRPEELKVAEQLTEGCIWAYDSQVTGIAPEIFSMVQCKESESCAWSEDEWYQAIRKASKLEESNLSDTRKWAIEAIRDERLAPGFTRLDDRRYILRPEAIESVFIMYRVTGETKWQDAAWRMFERIEKVSRTQIAASAIDDVTMEKPRKMDSMESFWLAETLKYFYLIFSDPGLISLDEYVLNTEAHPLKRPVR